MGSTRKVVGFSLGLLALTGIARGGDGEPPADAGPSDGGPDVGAEPEPEPPMTVCLCVSHEETNEVGELASSPALDGEAVRARVLASLPADIQARLKA